MPLWLVGDMLNTPWQPTTSRSLLERVAQRDAERLGAGLAGLERDGNRALAAASPPSHVLAPNVAGLLPNCFSYAAM